jgi:DNA-binding protein YbaB
MDMNTNYTEQIEQVIEEYRKRREDIATMQQKMLEIRCSGTAPRRTVTVTVGSQGQIVDVSFPTKAYQRMAPAELSAAILAAHEEARSKSLDEMAAMLAPTFPAGADVRGVLSGKADLRSLLPGEPRGAGNFVQDFER